MKYPNTINWNGKDYIAPAGYYFLNLGDALIDGDGFLGLNGIENYFVLNLKIKVAEHHHCPSVRLIPVEKVPAPAKLQYKEITDIAPGDLFLDTQQKSGCLVIQCKWDTNKYSLSGRNGLFNYANCQEVTREVMISYLNENKKIFICNINDKIKKTIEAAVKMI